MMEPEDKPQPPAPPTPLQPPLPPGPEVLSPAPRYTPLTPMMEFLQRRLEALEKDLLVERERSRSAANALEQQQALRAEVETNLKAMGDQLRREKAEKDTEEAKSHARGRIDALEKRLDEMHQSFVSLLKDAIGQRDAGAQTVAASQSALTFSQADLAREQGSLAKEQAAVRQEIAALDGTIKNLLEQIGQWRAEARGITDLAPELRGLSRQVPADARRLEEQLAQRLADFEAGLKETLSQWQYQARLESEKQDERALAFAREKAALQRAWEEQNHALRDEFLRERLRREAEVGQGLQEVLRRLEAAKDGGGASALHDKLERLLERLSQSAPAKDQVIQSLERERDDLLKSLRDKAASLKRYSDERREIEKTLGESVAAVHLDLDKERLKAQVLSARVSELEAQAQSWQDKIASAERLAQDQRTRAEELAAERDQLAKAWHAELERARAQVEERDGSQAAWQQRLSAAGRELEEQAQRASAAESAAGALRGQIATLAEQLSRAVQERDEVLRRFSSWEEDRRKLLETIREKDEMISMLNATFQGVLKKSP